MISPTRTRLASRNRRSRHAAVLFLAAACAGGCVVRGLEAQLLERFFHASRLYDRAALSNIATVVFNPATAGIVQDFEVVGIERVAGNAQKRQVTIEAPVRRPDGQVVAQTLRATIEQRDGRWMVTAITGGS